MASLAWDRFPPEIQTMILAQYVQSALNFQHPHWQFCSSEKHDHVGDPDDAEILIMNLWHALLPFSRKNLDFVIDKRLKAIPRQKSHTLRAVDLLAEVFAEETLARCVHNGRCAEKNTYTEEEWMEYLGRYEQEKVVRNAVIVVTSLRLEQEWATMLYLMKRHEEYKAILAMDDEDDAAADDEDDAAVDNEDDAAVGDEEWEGW